MSQPNNRPPMGPRGPMGPGGPRRGPGGPMGRMMMTVEKPKEGKKTILRLIRYFKREKYMVIALMAVVVFHVLCSVYAPKLQSQAIDEITNHNFGVLPSILVIMLIVYVLNSVCTLFQSLLSAHLSQRIVKRMREDLFDKIVNLPIKYLDTHPHGDIMSRMTNDVENVSHTVSMSMSSLVNGVLTIIGTVGMMVYLCWQLALLSCVTVVLTVLVTKTLSSKMRKFFRKRQELLGHLNGTV